MTRHGLRSPHHKYGWWNQGRDSEECRQASRAALLGIWHWLRDAVRETNREQWLAALWCAVALAAAWWSVTR